MQCVRTWPRETFLYVPNKEKKIEIFSEKKIEKEKKKQFGKKRNELKILDFLDFLRFSKKNKELKKEKENPSAKINIFRKKISILLLLLLFGT